MRRFFDTIRRRFRLAGAVAALMLVASFAFAAPFWNQTSYGIATLYAKTIQLFDSTDTFKTSIVATTQTVSGSTQTIPDQAGTSRNFVFDTLTQTLTNKTLTAPVLSGSVTGTYTLAGTPTITAPALSAPVITGAASIGTGATLAAGVIDASRKVLAASATYSATITPAALTGFSWTVVAGATYDFDIELDTTMTTSGGLNLAFALTTATLTSIRYSTYAATGTDNGTAVSTTGTTATSATNMFSSKTAAYTTVRVRGSFVVNAGGTFALTGCQETSAGAGDATLVLIGSRARVTRVL